MDIGWTIAVFATAFLMFQLQENKPQVDAL